MLLVPFAGLLLAVAGELGEHRLETSFRLTLVGKFLAR